MTAPTMFIMREKGMKGLKILNIADITINPMLKYLKCFSSTLSKYNSISLVLLTSKVHGNTVTLPKR